MSLWPAFWSYVAIPLLVIGTLAWSKRLSVRALVLDALTLTLLKCACTFAFSLVLREITPFPAPVHQTVLPHSARTAWTSVLHQDR